MQSNLSSHIECLKGFYWSCNALNILFYLNLLPEKQTNKQTKKQIVCSCETHKLAVLSI